MRAEFRVLGPLEVRRDGHAVALPSGNARVVLATLLLQPNRVVPAAELIDRLWDGSPPNPARAKATLHTIVMRLRKALGEVNCVRTTRDGYFAQVAPGELDLERFRTLVAAGSLAEGVQLWRGAVLSNVPSDSLRRDAGSALTEERLDVLERRIEADLELGRARELVAELRALTRQHPVRERFWEQLMLALYRSDQQVEALNAHLVVSTYLSEELGVDPGPRLRELHHRILNADPGLSARTEATRAPVPRQLPAHTTNFVGRDAELRLLDSMLELSTQDDGVVICAINGMAGIGKTTLAVHWGHRVADRFVDGQLYVNLRGFDPAREPTRPEEVIRGFLEAFEIPPERIPSGEDARTALYRSLLADRTILLLLDNARDTEQVRPLLPAGSACLVVVTSRDQLTGLVVQEGARPVALDEFGREAAEELLTRQLGKQRVAAEPEVVSELIDRCAGLPLALAVVAARAAVNPDFPLRALADELADEQTRLDALDAGEPATSVRGVFSWSYQHLTERAARVFRLLSVHPGPDISSPAAASLTGLTTAQVRSALGELTRAHLLAQRTPGRFSFHDLLSAYAGAQATEVDSEAERAAALHRLLDHHLHTAYQAALLLNPMRDTITLAPAAPGVVAERFEDYRQAWAWFEREFPALRAVIARAEETRSDSHAWQIPWTLANFLDRQGRWHDWIVVQRTALVAAERSGDRGARAHAHRALGQACTLLRSFADAEHHLRCALELERQVGNRPGQAGVHRALALMRDAQGRHADALRDGEQALELYRELDHVAGQAGALNQIGWYHCQLGHHRQALEYCEQALALHRKLGDRTGEASTLDSLGYARHHLGDHQGAVTAYREALGAYRELGDRFEEAATLSRLSDTHRAVGDDDSARQVLRDALVILDRLQHPDAADVRAKIRRLDASCCA